MNESKRTASGIVVNCAAVMSSFVALYFLSPFVVGRLGATAYGAWAVIGSITSYIALLDLGMRGATMLLVSRFSSVGEHERAAEAISAVLWIRLGIAALALLISVGLGFFIHDVIDAPEALLSDVRIGLVIGSVTVIVTLLGGVFGGVLAALNRFDVISAGAILHTTVRTAGTILVLREVPSLIVVAGAELAAALVTEAVLVISAFRFYPELRLRFRPPTHEVMRSIFRYSGSLTLVQAFIRVMQYSQSIIIAAFLPVSSVAFYSIGNTLIEGVRQIFYTISPVLTPLASRMEAGGRHQEVGDLVRGGTRLMLVVTMPILMTLYLRGETFIGIWMGPEYKELSGEVLRILTIGMFFVAATACADSIVLGLHDLRSTVAVNGAQALVTVAMSVVFIRSFGVAGVAWSVTLPTLVLRTVIWPAWVCRRVGIPLRHFLMENWGKPLAVAIPFALATIWAERHWHADSTGAFFLQVFAVLPVYALTCAVVLWSDVKAVMAIAGIVRSPALAIAPGSNGNPE